MAEHPTPARPATGRVPGLPKKYIETMDLIIGSTLTDAKAWRQRFAPLVPGLARARTVSAHSYGWAHVQGGRVRDVYITPNAEEGQNFRLTLLIAQRAQRKGYGPAEPIHLAELRHQFQAADETHGSVCHCGKPPDHHVHAGALKGKAAACDVVARIEDAAQAARLPGTR